MDFAQTLLWSSVLMFVVMSGTWWLARRWNNYSVVDGAWAGSFFVVAVFFTLTQSGWELRKAIMLTVVGLWSLRLAYFLTKRIYRHHPAEDSRYKQLRSEYGSHVAARFFIFFQYQAISVVILMVPLLETFRAPRAELNPFEILGWVISLLALLGETVADAQAQKFKADPANHLRTCRVGLWRYSRHPNYFFESCIWWGFYLTALGAAQAYYTIYAPLAILFLLLKVTGVPPSEAAALKKRGEEYRRYQRTTSKFFPWFPKKE